MGLVRGLGTVFAFLAFAAVVFWAWGQRQKEAFREAAQLPLEEDDDTEPRS
ncbi:MAG: CcoQ/FixQ family Cbb3-type cytochrome c oxidase assembly chaperone [Gammaproteobacteria bacterium]